MLESLNPEIFYWDYYVTISCDYYVTISCDYYVTISCGWLIIVLHPYREKNMKKGIPWDLMRYYGRKI